MGRWDKIHLLQHIGIRRRTRPSLLCLTFATKHEWHLEKLRHKNSVVAFQKRSGVWFSHRNNVLRFRKWRVTLQGFKWDKPWSPGWRACVCVCMCMCVLSLHFLLLYSKYCYVTCSSPVDADCFKIQAHGDCVCVSVRLRPNFDIRMRQQRALTKRQFLSASTLILSSYCLIVLLSA